MSARSMPLLGTLAVDAGLLSSQDLDAVLRRAAERGVPLGEMLFKLGYLTHDDLLDLLARQHDTEVYDLAQWQADQAALEALDPDFIQRHQVLPISIGNGRLVVAAAGPFVTPLHETLAAIAEHTGCRADAVICDARALRRRIAQLFGDPMADAALSTTEDRPEIPDFASLVGEIRAEADHSAAASDVALRADLEDALEAGKSALLAARTHAFASAIERDLARVAMLVDRAQRQHQAGAYGEGLRTIDDGRARLQHILEDADAIAKAWGPLLQHVELLRTRIAQLETEGAADFAPEEVGRLREIRDAVRDCVGAKSANRLRELLDEGQLLVERVAALSPRHNRRERLIESLNHVREVLARARKLGAQTLAPAAIEAAYGLLDDADAQARDGHWEAVQDSLAQALAHAEAAEQQALAAAEARQGARARLLELCDAADRAIESLIAHPESRAVLPSINAARSVTAAARVAADGTEDLSPHTAKLDGLVNAELPRLRREADAARTGWDGLIAQADEISQGVQAEAGAVLGGDTAAVIHELAALTTSFTHAVAARNLEEARRVLQTAHQQIRDFWDLAGRLDQDRRELGDRIARASLKLAAAEGQVASARLRETTSALRHDLERASAAITHGNFGDAAALLDDVEHMLATDLDPAIREQQHGLQTIFDGLGKLAERFVDLAALDAPVGAPDAFTRFADAARDAALSAARGDLDTAQAALDNAATAECDAVEQTSTVLSERRAALEANIAEVERAVQAAVGDAAGQGAPDLLEEAYLELNGARSVLEERGAHIRAEDVLRIERHLRNAERTAQQVRLLSAADRARHEGVEHRITDWVDALVHELEEARAEGPRANHGTLDEAEQSLGEARTAAERRNSARAIELLRDVERTLEQWRIDDQQRRHRLRQFRAYFETELPERLTALDGKLLDRLAPDAWSTLRQIRDTAADLVERGDADALAGRRDEAVRLLAACADRMQQERTRRQTDAQQSKAIAFSALRLARHLQADTRSPDLFAAAEQMARAGDGALAAQRWEEAVAYYAAAAERAAEAQDAALAAARAAFGAQQDLLQAVNAHLATGNLPEARSALTAALAAARRAAPPPPSSHEESADPAGAALPSAPAPGAEPPTGEHDAPPAPA